MGKLSVFLFAAAFCFLASAASTYNLQGKEGIVDFGEVSADTVVEKTIHFDDRIKSAVASCDCLKVKLSKQSRFFMPAVYNLEVKFDSSGYKGDVYQEIQLLDKNDNLQKIKVKAFVLPKSKL